MDGGGQRGGFPFFAFVHLHDQQLYRLLGDLVDLLSYGADGENGGTGDGGVVKSDNAVFFREGAVFSYDEI